MKVFCELNGAIAGDVNGKGGRVEPARRVMDHPANRIDVRVAVPEIRLDLHARGGIDELGVVTRGDQLDREAAMPKVRVIGGADRIECRSGAAVLADRHRAADQQILSPVSIGHIVVIHGRDDVGAHLERDQKPDIAPLDAIPAQEVGQQGEPALLFLRGDEVTTTQFVVHRGLSVGNDDQIEVFDLVEQVDRLGRVVDRCGDDHTLHGSGNGLGTALRAVMLAGRIGAFAEVMG